jgi:hypothetical protein
VVAVDAPDDLFAGPPGHPMALWPSAEEQHPARQVPPRSSERTAAAYEFRTSGIAQCPPSRPQAIGVRPSREHGRSRFRIINVEPSRGSTGGFAFSGFAERDWDSDDELIAERTSLLGAEDEWYHRSWVLHRKLGPR